MDIDGSWMLALIKLITSDCCVDRSFNLLQEGDIVKLDFGTHVAGRIVDSAFTIAFDPKFDPLIRSTIDGTNTGIKAAGIDVRFSEIGAAIQEAIESYEMEVDERSIPIKSISNLNGHSIGPYQVKRWRSGEFDFQQKLNSYSSKWR